MARKLVSADWLNPLSSARPLLHLLSRVVLDLMKLISTISAVMESANGEVTFNKPDFNDDSASGSTHIGPEDDIQHKEQHEVESTNIKDSEKLAASTDDAGVNEHTATRTNPSGIATTHQLDHDRKKSSNGLRKTTTATDAIQPAPSADHGHDSDDLTLKVKETTREAANKVKRKIHLHRVSVSAPVKHMNPTNVRAHIRFGDDDERANTADPEKDMQLKWNARSSRVGRPESMKSDSTQKKPFGRRCLQVLKNICIMFSTFPYWDMAFWSGWSYSIGSVLFVIDGAWAWTPLVWPSSEFAGESEYGVGLLFFIGALFYQVGAVMAYLEAVNDGSFAGVAMKRLLEGHDEDKKKLLDEKLHMFFGHIIPHHHHNDEEEHEEGEGKEIDPEAGWKTRDRADRPGSVYPEGKKPATRRGGVDMGPAEEGDFHEYLTWQWWPTWKAFKEYHIKQIGYVACTIQLLGATLYGITGVVALPGVLSSLAAWQELGAYWVPQVIASCCFLTAGIMFTLETQDKWYRPLPLNIGWWIGAWATIGSCGFL